MFAPRRRRRSPFLAGAIFVMLWSAGAGVAADSSPEQIGVVSHIKVVSDKVKDVSSYDAWKASYIKPGMTDRAKALAAWETVVAFRHQAAPPNEYVGVEDHPLDPIKTFNVYGYNMCNGASAAVIGLARHAGLQARGWAISSHSVPEVLVDGKWCMLDGSLVNYFETPEGKLAGVEDISSAVGGWLEKNPRLRGNNSGLTKFQQNDGWTGWKNGPGLLAACKWYDAGGWLPAGTHGWSSTMQEYGNGKQNHLYEYGHAPGYEVNLQLRRGERIIRNWSHKGLHVNMAEGDECDVLKSVPGEDDMKYSPKFGDLAPGRIGNGTHEYDLPLASGAFRGGMLVAENLATKSESRTGPAVQVKDAGRPAALAFRMPSSYVYLGGQLAFNAAVGDGGSITVSFSDNNGLVWKEIAKVTAPGEHKVDLKPLVFRRYDYRLKLVLSGKGTGLESMKVTHDIQHSQRPLPALGKGDNTIRFSAGPQEGTVTVEGSTKLENKGRNLLYTDFHPQAKGIAEGSNIKLAGGEGEIVFPVETPGDITRLRVGAHYRARDARDGWDVAASFDAGKTWKPVGKLEGPYAGMSKAIALNRFPAGARAALVKFTGKQRNTTLIFDLRIDADYNEPHGGQAPVKVTYAWEENGQPKQHVHVAKSADEQFTIRCEQKPVMKSIALER
jgi:hypothetical protein